jgi:hypothetical protein
MIVRPYKGKIVNRKTYFALVFHVTFFSWSYYCTKSGVFAFTS